MADLERMKELERLLREASRRYYQESDEIMSNLEYDRLYDELLSLEKELFREIKHQKKKRIEIFILAIILNI